MRLESHVAIENMLRYFKCNTLQHVLCIIHRIDSMVYFLSVRLYLFMVADTIIDGTLLNLRQFMKQNMQFISLIFLIFLGGCASNSSSRKYTINQIEISSIKPIWDVVLPGKNIESRLLTNRNRDSIYFMTDSTLIALDIVSGQILWERENNPGSPYPNNGDMLRYISNDILIATGNRGHNIQALEADTGRLLWKKEFGFQRSIAYIQSDSDRIYLAQWRSRYAYVTALDLYTGEKLWEISNSDLQVGGAPNTMLLENDRLFVETSKLWVLDGTSGSILKTYPLTFIRSESNILEDTIVYRSDKSVQALRLNTNQNEEIWHYIRQCSDGKTNLLLHPNVKVNELYIASPCHYLVKLDKDNGREIWSTKTIGYPDAIAIQGNELFAITGSATLYQIDVSNGNILGNLQFKPSSRDNNGRQSILYINDWIIVTYGNNQLFGFQKKH